MGDDTGNQVAGKDVASIAEEGYFWYKDNFHMMVETGSRFVLLKIINITCKEKIS
jgi:hypothetical protein